VPLKSADEPPKTMGKLDIDVDDVVVVYADNTPSIKND